MDYLIYIAVLPVALLLMYIYKKDGHKEPRKMLIKTFLFGILIVVPAIILEVVLSIFFPTESNIDLYKLFINVFIGIALVEESLKWLIIKFSIYKDQNFDESFDGIVYAVFGSLGFACVENILYVFLNGVSAGILRAVTAVPLHACTGIIMGYCIGKAKLYTKDNNKLKENSNIFFSLFLPTTVHSIYDFLVFAEETEFAIIWGVLTIALYIMCFVLIKKSIKENQITIEKDIIIETKQNDTNISTKNQTFENTVYVKRSYCKHCGMNINGSNYCPNCGTKNE